MIESKFKSWDDTELFYRFWQSQVKTDKAIIYLHRGHEHSGRLSQLVEDMALPDCHAFAYDARGHGNSPGPRGYAKNFSCLVKDLDTFVRYVSTRYNIPIENMVVVANSVGAVVASTWVHDFAPQIRGMVLAAPAFRIKLYVPLAIPMLRMLMLVKPISFITSYVKSKFLTHDQEQARLYDADKLITKDIAVNILLGLHDTSTRVMEDAAAIHTPTLILSAGSDWVVKSSAQKRFFDGLSSHTKEFVEYPGFYHAVLYEKERKEAIDKSRDFILKCFETKPDNSFLLNSDKAGFSKAEYDRLAGRPCLCKAMLYGAQKLGMKTLGLLSNGVKLGFKYGFDSGKTLDYVYENKPSGKTFIGRMIDKSYLNAIGWIGIRQRKVHLEQALENAIDIMIQSGRKPQIMDIAAGAGRYVLDTLKEKHTEGITALLRDYKPENVAAIQKLAKDMQLEGITAEHGDAFDKESLAAITPKPNIVIISGLYELYPNNDALIKSLAGVSQAIEPGGILIYTGQPWHPQLEMIARTLTNREGNPWIMRRRCQAEMDELVRSADFKKTDMMIDEYGIFTVSTAIKENII